MPRLTKSGSTCSSDDKPMRQQVASVVERQAVTDALIARSVATEDCLLRSRCRHVLLAESRRGGPVPGAHARVTCRSVVAVDASTAVVWISGGMPSRPVPSAWPASRWWIARDSPPTVAAALADWPSL